MSSSVVTFPQWGQLWPQPLNSPAPPSGGGGAYSGVFLIDDNKNIWSCNSSGNCATAYVGQYNFLAGYKAGECTRPGTVDFVDNTFIGRFAGQEKVDTYSNTFIGGYSGQYNTGSYNTGIGNSTLRAYKDILNYYGNGLTVLNNSGIDVPSNQYYDLILDGNLNGTGLKISVRVINSGPDLGVLDIVVVDYSGQGFVVGEEIVIPGDQIGGISPTNDVVIQVTEFYTGFSHYINGAVAVGHYAGRRAYDDFGSVYVGSYAGEYAGQGTFNSTFIGRSAGRCSHTGFYNIAIGGYAGYNTSDGHGASFSNIFIGSHTGCSSTGHFYQTFVGAYAGCNINFNGDWSAQNTLFGAFAAGDATTAVGNSLFGTYSGYKLTTGSFNSAFGHFSGGSIGTASHNTAVGFYSMSEDINNTGLSDNCLSGPYNTAIGSLALAKVSPEIIGNTSVGYKTLRGTNRGVSTVTYHSLGTTILDEASQEYVVTLDNPSTIGDGSYRFDPVIKVARNASGELLTTYEILDPGSDQGAWTWTTMQYLIPGNKIGGVSPTDDLRIILNLHFPTLGENNTAIGTCSGAFACNANNNFFGGYKSGLWACDVDNNVAIGQCSGYKLNGDNNVAIGFKASAFSCSWTNPDASGSDPSSGIPSNNVAIGSYSGMNLGGDNNVFIGNKSGKGKQYSWDDENISIVSSSSVAGIATEEQYRVEANGSLNGYGAILYITRNLGVGSIRRIYVDYSGSDFVVGEQLTIPGNEIGGVSPTDDLIIQIDSLVIAQSPQYCTVAIGAYAGECAYESEGSTYVGAYAGQYASAIGWNFQDTFVGYMSGRCAYKGFCNTFIGAYAGYNATNTANNSFSNTYIGVCAGYYNDGNYWQTFVGAYAGYRSFNPVGNMDECPSAIFGGLAGFDITTGIGNSIFGGFAGDSITTGSYNTIVGVQSGWGLSTGSNNVLIGNRTGGDPLLQMTTQSNQIAIGNNNSTDAFIKIGWTVTSDERDKTCITTINHGREFLDKLDAVQFNWKDRESGEVKDEQARYGFIAQEVLDAEGTPAILVDDSDPENLKLRESMMIPVLFNIIKEMNQEITLLKDQINSITQS